MNSGGPVSLSTGRDQTRAGAGRKLAPSTSARPSPSPVSRVVAGEGGAEGAGARWRPTRAEALDLLVDAREELRDADEAIALTLASLRALADARRLVPFEADDERRVLGALVLGRATHADLDGIEPADFYAEGHATLYVAILEALRHEEALGVRVRPSMRRDPAKRAYEAARLRREHVRTILLCFADSAAAVCALETLPWPATCPREEIATVRALGRWRGAA